MKKMLFYLCVLLVCMALSVPAVAIEIVRQKNVATYIAFPIVDADGDIVTSAAGLDSETDAWGDGSAPDGFTDCTNEATEIGSTGIYYLSLAQAEMNNDYIYIQVKTSTSGAKTQHLLIRTMVGDPLNVATTDDGGTINVTSGKVDEVAALTGNTAQTGDAYAIVNSGTYGNSAIKGYVDDLETRLTATRAGYLDNLTNLDAAISTRSSHAAADVWSVGTRSLTAGVTVTTNNDKAGYSISGTKTTLDALNDIAATDVWSAATRTLSSGGYSGLTAADVDAIWDEVITGHSTSSSFGKVISDEVNGLRTYGDSGWATATGFSTLTASEVWDYTTRSLTELDEDNTTIDLDSTTVSASASISTEDKDDIVDRVWDEAIASHVGTGSTGEALTAAGASGNPWATDISTGYTGQAGEYIRNTWQNTNGVKDNDAYNGIEKFIRQNK